MIRALAEADLREELKAVDLPILLIWGDQDARSPLTVGDDLHWRLNNSQLVILDGAGHLTQVEAADRVNAELRRFFKQVKRR